MTAPGPAPLPIPERWSFETAEVAAGFDRHVREQLPWYSLATDATAQIVRHYLPERGLVYDLGCSTGNIGRAIEATLDERSATLVPVDTSAAMRERYAGPQAGRFLVADAATMELEPFDVAVCFLVMQFMAVPARAAFVARLRSRLRHGGVVVVLDRERPPGGYVSMVTSRLVLAAKLAAGADPRSILLKELSLGGVQRPLDPAELAPATEWFRFGDFVGWVIEG